MPNVRLSNSLPDWKVARTVFEEELKAIDRAFNVPSKKIRVPSNDDFAAHLLDVHRMWCEACPPPGGRGVRPNRDAGAGGSGSSVANPNFKRKISVSTSTQTTYGLYGLDMGLLDIPDDDDHDVDDDEDDEDDEKMLSMTCHGEDEELQADFKGGNPSLETSHQVPGLLHVHERDTQHQLNTGMEGCNKILSPLASGETNRPQNPARHIEFNAKSVTLDDSTSKACAGYMYIDRSYGCTICSKRFGKSTALKRHMLLHTAARPFHCPICNKAFARKELLALHMETSTHSASPTTGAACSICNKTFSMDALARHMRSHIRDKPHQCAPCGKWFITKELLSLHMQTHAGEKSFQCSICDMAFPVQANLDMHHYVAHTLEESASKTQHLLAGDVMTW